MTHILQETPVPPTIEPDSPIDAPPPFDPDVPGAPDGGTGGDTGEPSEPGQGGI
jgi:hypothetical protein